MNDIKRPNRVKRIAAQPQRPTEGSPVKTEALVQNDQSFDDLPSLTMTSPLPFEGSHTDSVMTALNEKKPKKKRRLVAKLLAGFLGIIILTAVGLVMWYNNQLAAVDPSSDQQVVVTLPTGTTAASVASLLHEHQLIKNEQAFQVYIKLKGVAGKLQAGVYRIAKSSDVASIVNKLTTGKTDTFTITFLPGATLAKHRNVLVATGYTEKEVDAALSKKYNHPLLATKPVGADLEGYIYGETYQMPSDATVEQILTRTFDEFYSVVQNNNLIAAYKAHGFTLHQGIILASIVQREIGSNAKDEPMVAGVFYNRLTKGMNLGSDVTYQYIADKTGVPRDPMLQSDYNTRIHTGLTPGPIASPGKGALLAVANPARHDYIFFLSGDDNVTYYGVTDEDHQRNIREHCQKKCQIL